MQIDYYMMDRQEQEIHMQTNKKVLKRGRCIPLLTFTINYLINSFYSINYL